MGASEEWIAAAKRGDRERTAGTQSMRPCARAASCSILFRHAYTRNVARKTTAARYVQFTGLALLLPTSTFVGYVIGYYLDKAFGTDWLYIVFLILGTAAGFVTLIYEVTRDSHGPGS